MPTLSINNRDYEPTTQDGTITLSDADYALIEAIKDLTTAINRLASK